MLAGVPTGRSLRVVFLGNDRWSLPPLEALAGSTHDVALVITRPPRPERRGRGTVPTPVAAAARRLGLSFREVDTVKTGPGFEAIAEAAPDVLAVVAYGEILPPAVLALPLLGPVNLHFSLLPELRGAAPVQRAILEGLTATGVTTILMDEGMDTGPVLIQAAEPIEDDDDAGSLGARLAAIGGRLLVDTLDRLGAGELRPRPQDHALATLAPRLRPEERWIDWSWSAEDVGRRVRAFAPQPGAATRFRGGVLKVVRVEAGAGSAWEPPRDGGPGTIGRVDRDGVVVIAGDAAPVRLLEVAPEGRARMPGGAFVNGFHPKEGERLG
jgi:methionyl-tRNA formyltransferase